MPKLHIPQDVSFQSLLAPAADAAGRTSSYFSLKGAVKAWIVVHIGQGNAATVLLSPLQALAVAGTSPIACRASRIWTKLTAATVDWTAQTEATTYTTDAGVDTKVVVFEIDPNKSLTPESATGVYDCVAISTGASNAANITSAMLLWQPKHKGASTTSVITD
jgi:hypothetical protein